MFPVIENTISLGNILTILSVVGSIVAFMWTLRGDINIVKNDLEHLEESQKALSEAFSQLGSILTSVAVQDTRLTMIEKKIDELAHGQGYVEPRKH